MNNRPGSKSLWSFRAGKKVLVVLHIKAGAGIVFLGRLFWRSPLSKESRKGQPKAGALKKLSRPPPPARAHFTFPG